MVNFVVVISGVTVVNAKASSKMSAGNEDENGGTRVLDNDDHLRAEPAASMVAASENAGSTQFVQVSHLIVFSMLSLGFLSAYKWFYYQFHIMLYFFVAV